METMIMFVNENFHMLIYAVLALEALCFILLFCTPEFKEFIKDIKEIWKKANENE